VAVAGPDRALLEHPLVAVKGQIDRPQPDLTGVDRIGVADRGNRDEPQWVADDHDDGDEEDRVHHVEPAVAETALDRLRRGCGQLVGVRRPADRAGGPGCSVGVGHRGTHHRLVSENLRASWFTSTSKAMLITESNRPTAAA